ncbi:MAG: fructose-bisphosphate aldolase class II, partial [Sulfurimonas sp.]
MINREWATWVGVKDYYEKNKEYMQGQIGNPDGEDKPN